MRYLQETAIVSHTEGDFAFLKTDSSSQCGHCDSKSSCGSLSLFNVTPKTDLKVENTLGLIEGDSVVVALPSNRLLLGTLLIYLFPLLSLLLFSVIGRMVGGETVSILAGFGGFFASLIIVKKLISHQSLASKFNPKLLRKVIPLTTV